MTEQERMKQGYVWQDDDENMSLQAHTKALVREFNSMPPEDMEGREPLIHDIFGKVGKNVWITPPLTAAVGKYVSIGDGTYSNMNLTLIDDWKITIGKNVLIGPNVTHKKYLSDFFTGKYALRGILMDEPDRFHR